MNTSSQELTRIRGGLLNRRLIPHICGLIVCWIALSGSADVVLSGGGLTIVEEGGSFAPGNLSAQAGATPMAVDELVEGGFSHLIVELNDGTYGNSSSWISGGGLNVHGVAFAGVSFGLSPVTNVNSFAFGRDNTGRFTDRTHAGAQVPGLAIFTLQYTQVANPHTNLDLPDDTTMAGVNPLTGWVTIGTLDYVSPGGINFANPSLRHRYLFDPVNASGLRMVMPPNMDSIFNGGGPIGATRPAFDEFEAYRIPEPSSAVACFAGLSLLFIRRKHGRHSLEGALKVDTQP